MDARTRALPGLLITHRRLAALTATLMLAWLPAVAGGGPALEDAAAAAPASSAAHAPARTRAREEAARKRRAAERRRRAAAERRRKARRARERRRLERRIAKDPTLILDERVRKQAFRAGAKLPLTLRLRRPYEAFPGDDTLQLTFDDGAIPWPMPGTVKPAAPLMTSIDGSASMEADYGADTSAYPVLGTVETLFGGAISMTATPFQIADVDPGGCTTAKSIAASAIAIGSAGVRFGILNPFNGEVNGTLDLRTAIRTTRTNCDDTTATADALTGGGDRALPVAFDGHFRVSPGVSADGAIRWGILTVDDATQPQRSTFGLVYACTDPAAADGCDRRAFPVRTKLLTLVAEVLVGDVMPPPATLP